MTNIKHIYKRSERHTAPIRKCPSCEAQVRPSWSRPLYDMGGGFDPEYSAAWRCSARGCLQGEF